jgi:hypothetical protein
MRYEFSQPGAMLHADTKKLGRIVGGTGHRIHGDCASTSGRSAPLN